MFDVWRGDVFACAVAQRQMTTNDVIQVSGRRSISKLEELSLFVK